MREGALDHRHRPFPVGIKPEVQDEILRRLKSASGHLGGIARMVGEEAYCIDIIKQIDAVEQALKKIRALMLENHLDTCVTHAIRSDDPTDRERVLAELMEVYAARR
ncbi:MAG: metal-sensitive transcriptional regulator [Candidatus Methylomirabilales bacterium]